MSQKKVLIVDDQPNWLELFAELLEDEYEITTAKSYAEGLAALSAANAPFHVVISDIRLEDQEPTNQEGLDLLAELNELSDLTESIVITGYPSYRTQKEALRLLNSVEYMLKYPEDGRGFNYSRFRQVVRQAALKAEKRRGDAFISSEHRVLVVENDDSWLYKLADLLEIEKYQVHECQDLNQFLHVLIIKSYHLIVLNYEFTLQEPLLLTRIREHQSDVEILLTAREINVTEAAQMLQERRIFSVIMLDDSFDEYRFRVIASRALAPRDRQYVLASIKESGQENELQVGHSYTCVLTMQSKPSNEGLSLYLAPRIRNQSSILKVVVYTQDIDIRPDKQVYWELPASGAPAPLEFSFTPKATGKRTLSFSFKEGLIWLGHLTKDLMITPLKKGLFFRKPLPQEV